MRNMQNAMQIVHLGKAHDDPKTRYQQAQEDRLNDNFRAVWELLQSIAGDGLPAYRADDEGKVLKIVNGVPTWVTQ